MVLGAINPGPQVRQFIAEFNLPYTVGECENSEARRFMGFPEMQMAYVPWLTVIDRNGQIRQQLTGSDRHILSDDTGLQEKHLKAQVEPLLAEKAGAAKAAAPAAPAKKAPAKK